MRPSNPSSHATEQTSPDAEPSSIPIASAEENGMKKDAEEVESGEHKASWPENSGERLVLFLHEPNTAEGTKTV